MKTFKPMRSCAPDPKHPIKYGQRGRLGSPKLDGIRSVVKDGTALTKSCKPVPNHYIREWLAKHIPEGFDGELISGPPADEECYSRTFSAVMTQKGEPEFCFYVFDLWNLPDIDAGTRRTLLKGLCAGLKEQNPEVDHRLVFVPQYRLDNQSQADELYSQFLDQGYEGMVSVDPVAYYKFGKATPVQQEQLKIKPEDDFEAKILGFYEAMENLNESFTNEAGETKRSTNAENKIGKGMVGGYRVQDAETGVIFNVSAGKMKHPERIAEWEAYLLNPEHRKGTYLKYRKMTYGSMTNGAARHGRWIGWRDVTDMEPEDTKESE